MDMNLCLEAATGEKNLHTVILGSCQQKHHAPVNFSPSGESVGGS